jgi:hypothetical protein
MAVRAIPLSVCRRGPPKGYQTGFKRCSDAQYLFNYQHRWHKCKSGWSLKTERIRLNWHVYIDTTHSIRHLFLTWTSLCPFTFPKLNSNICGTSACFFFNFWLALLSGLYSGTYLPGSNINGNKINHNTDHISAFTQPPILIMFTYKHMYANLTISVVSTQICHPSNQASIK